MTRGLGLFLFVDNRSAVCFRRPAPALPSSPLRRRHRRASFALARFQGHGVTFRRRRGVSSRATPADPLRPFAAPPSSSPASRDGANRKRNTAPSTPCASLNLCAPARGKRRDGAGRRARARVSEPRFHREPATAAGGEEDLEGCHPPGKTRAGIGRGDTGARRTRDRTRARSQTRTRARSRRRRPPPCRRRSRRADARPASRCVVERGVSWLFGNYNYRGGNTYFASRRDAGARIPLRGSRDPPPLSLVATRRSRAPPFAPPRFRVLLALTSSSAPRSPRGFSPWSRRR